jgi:ArsR family transcriptional regulator
MDYEETSLLFKAFCDPNRLMILENLKSGEKCACKLLEDLDIVQSTLSHHMKILCESGVVIARKEGKWMHYSINKNGIENARGSLLELETV